MCPGDMLQSRESETEHRAPTNTHNFIRSAKITQGLFTRAIIHGQNKEYKTHLYFIVSLINLISIKLHFVAII